MLGVAGCAGGDDFSGGVVEIALQVVCRIERCRVVLAQPKVQRQVRRHLVSVRDERLIRMLAIVKGRDRRNFGRNGQAQEHVGDRVAAALLVARIHRRVLTAELNVAPGLSNLQQIELVKPDLRPRLEQMFSARVTDRVADLDDLGSALGRREKGFAQSVVPAEPKMRQSVDGWIVGNARKLQLWRWKMLTVSGDVGNVMATVESDTE